MSVSLYESLSEMAKNNESIILSNDVLKAMYPIVSLFGLDESKVRSEWMSHQVAMYSECKSTEDISHISRSIVDDVTSISDVSTQLNWLASVEQPEQRTPEWFTYRHTVITASSLSKVLESKSTYDSILKEKVLPEAKRNFSGNAIEHGIRNEPNAQKIYESLTNTKISEYGCIKHPKISHIGASPDGIVTVAEDPNYIGRMLEIKCLYSREMTGIPIYKYWVQVQIQLEVCDLEYCDFFECKINDALTEDEFYERLSKDTIGRFYGIVVEYQDLSTGNADKKKHLYSPISLDEKGIREWHDRELNPFTNDGTRRWYNRSYYWELKKYSKVTIQRNREWFSITKQKIDSFWSDVEDRRQQIEKDPSLCKTMFEDKRNDKVHKLFPKDVCLIDEDF